MKTKKAYSFYNDVYFQNFFFIPNWTRDDVIRVFDFPVHRHAQGMAFQTEEGIVIWIRDFTFENLDYLHHECIHATNIMFEEKGVKISTKNDEAQTYMSQWIFSRCRQRLKIKKK
jgi:hypothetical protein